MRIAFNPSTVAALTSPPNNKDITFDLRGQNIFARGVKFYGTDTNTWRDIKVNNVSIGSHTLDLRNGSNTTLTNTNGVVTINSTWRPVVDSLTSDSTTSSLSAKQGKVLKGLLDGKSNTGHTHDDRYLRLSGGTMNSDALITFADSGSWGTDKGPQGARGGLRWTGQSDSIKLYAEETAADNLDLVIQFGDDNSNGLSIRNKTNTQTSYISASGVITTGTFKGNLDWSYITNKPATATRWPSWAEVTGKPSSFTPSTHTHGLSNSVFFLNMPSISGNAKWKEVFGYPVNYNLLLSVRINSPAPEWCVGNYGSGILYGGSDTKGFMSSAYNEPLIMWAGGNGSSDDSVPKWYIGIRGTHKSIYNLTTIASEANAAYNLRHSHANKSVLDGITSGLVSNWNTAYTFVHTITGTDTDKVINKWDEIVNFLAGIDSNNKLNTLLNSKLSVYELADKTNVGAIKNNGIYYSTTDASSSTLTNSPFSNGFALINMTSYDGGDDLRRSRLAFNAYGEIKVSDDRSQLNTAETWYNVLTSKNSGISDSTIKLNGTSITVYSSGTADGRYVKKSGDTMSGALNFANGTWNKVGDDVYMGDHNIGGQLCLMGTNGTTGLSFHKYGDASIRKSITFDGNTLYMNGSCNYATLSNQTNLLAMNTVPNKTATTSIGSWSPISGRYVFHQRWTDTSTGSDGADFGIYLDGNLTANMVLDGYYNSLSGFRVIGAKGGFLKANGTIDNSTYLTSHQSLSNYYTKGEINTKLSGYLPLSGGTMTGQISSNYSVGTWIRGCTNAILKATADGYNSLICAPIKSGNISISAWTAEDNLNFGYAKKGKTENNFDTRMYWDAPNNNLHAAAFTGHLYGTADNAVNADNADKLDGIHANGLLTALSNANKGISITVGGTTKSLSNISVSHADTVGQSWNVSIQGQHWSRLYVGNPAMLHHSSIFSIRGSIGCVVFCQTFLVEANHPGSATIICLFSGSYTQPKMRTLVKSDGTVLVDLYWSGSDCSQSFSTQQMTISVTANVLQGSISPTTSLTNDDTIPSGYSNTCEFQCTSKTSNFYDVTLNTLQANSIKNLSIGGGIYWNPYVESATDGSDAASITVVKAGVAGGTTLVLSQQNDANDTIQFKTSTAARLYHNSNQILTSGDTKVSSGKGYINNTEITQVNNSDTLDGWHKDNIQGTGYITSSNSLTSYWFKMYDITVTGYQYNDITITFLVSEGYTAHFSIFYLKIRQNGTNNSGNYNLGVTLRELVGNLRDKVVAYYNNSTGNVQLWGNTDGQWGTMNYTIIKKTTRTATDSSSLGTLTAQGFSSVQTPPSTGYTKLTMSRVGSVSYSDSTGSVHWNNVTNKPSTFNPAAHTHTWASITDKIVAGNEFNIVNAGFKKSMWFNYLPINDRNKTATISSYHFGNGAKGYASVQASGFIKSGGNVSQLLRADGGVAAFNWSGQSGQPTWLWGGNSQHSYYVYNPSNFRVAYAASAGNADTLDGEHANSFVRAGAIDTDKTDLNALDTYSFIKSVNSEVADHSPKRNTGWYNVIQLVHRNGSGDGPGYIGQIALGMTTNTDDMFFRTKYQNTWNSWKTVIHSGNIADQSVKYATSSGNADTLDKLHASAFLQLKNNRFTQYNKGTWTKILKFTTPASTIQASISFTWHPSEYARNVWADFSINIRGGITFFVSWKGEERRTLMCVGTDGEYAVWVKGNKAAWDPYGVIQVTQTWDITSYETGSLAYSDITPTGTYSAEASMRGYVLQADRLITSRNINGTAFNGTKDITTSYWGTARNITIGKSIKSVNGSANVAWSLADIGAASDDHTHPYLPLAGGEMNNGAQITRKAKGVAWVQGRDSALIKDTTSSGYHALWSLKTKEGSWEFGESQNDINTDNVPVLTYITDTNYTNKKNTITYQQKFQLASGTIALTSQIPSSLPANGGNADTVDGYHAGGLFTAFGNENHNITATIGGVTKKFQVNYASDSDKLDGKHASDFATAGHNHDGRYLKLSGGTLTGGIEIQGTISGSNYASSEGFYTNEHNSLILRGDATYGKSGILFTSSKGTNSINQTSDKGFIQFQSYGGTNTTGEENKLVIGVGNDSTDMVYIQTPSVTGLKHVVGTNPYTIWDSGNLTKLSQLTNDKGFVTGSVNGKTITINGTSTTWSNTWRPISDDYEKGDASTSLSTLGSLTLYNDLLSAIPTIPTIPNPTNYYWANIKVSSSSSTTTSPTVNVLTATRVCAGHDPGISNSISCSNWFRSSGETGWYSSTYGGGWYMSDKDWIRSWGSKALYINNSIRSTNYQVMYGSTSASAARLESTTTLVYGTDTSSNSINSYLRGTTVTLQVKKGTSINHNALQLTADYIYCNNYCDMKQGAVVSGGNFTVNNNSYLAQSAGAKVGIGTSSLSDSLSVNGSMNVKLTNVNWDKACTDKSLVIRKTTLDPSKVNSYEYVSKVLTFQFGDGTHSNNRGTCTVSVPAGYKIQMDVYDLKTTHNRPIANIQVSGTNTLQMTLGGGYYISGTDSANVSYFLVPDAPLDFPKTTVPQLLIADSTIQFQNSDKLLALTNKGVYINGAVNLQINGYHKQPIFIASAIYNKSSWNTIECRANAALITCNTPIADCTVNDFIVQYSGVTVTSVRIENFKFVCVLGDTNGSYYGVQIYYMPH